MIRVVLEQPVFAVMGILGILLMLLFRRRKPLIGYSRTDNAISGRWPSNSHFIRFVNHDRCKTLAVSL